MSNFTIKNIYVRSGDQKIIRGVSLSICPGEIHALMGPNGSGKSTLAYAIAGHPEYFVARGDIFFGKKSLKNLSPEARSKQGIFLSFQEPPEIGGVQTGLFLKKLIALHEPIKRERVYRMRSIRDSAEALSTTKDFLSRLLNKDFSGGEKKKSEILQLIAAAPKFAILDEIDSGLDFDSLLVLADIIKNMAKQKVGFLLISHYTKVFHVLRPDRIHVIKDGKIIESGTDALLKKIDKNGFAKL